jgi:hypothetical protein
MELLVIFMELYGRGMDLYLPSACRPEVEEPTPALHGLCDETD